MNYERLYRQYANGRTIKWLANEYGVSQDVIRNIMRQKRDEEKAYMKEMQEIAKLLPRHKDNEADQKWEQALGQGAFN